MGEIRPSTLQQSSEVRRDSTVQSYRSAHLMPHSQVARSRPAGRAAPSRLETLMEVRLARGLAPWSDAAMEREMAANLRLRATFHHEWTRLLSATWIFPTHMSPVAKKTIGCARTKGQSVVHAFCDSISSILASHLSISSSNFARRAAAVDSCFRQPSSLSRSDCIRAW